MKFDIWSFILMGLAVWRISNMLADTDQAGPFGVLDWIRSKSGLKYDTYSNPYSKRGSLADMISCVYCNGLWIGLIFVILYLVLPTLTIIISAVFALNSVSILLEEWKNHGRG